MGLEKATLTNTVTGEHTRVLFNPEQCTLSRQNNFAEIAVHGLRSPLLQFVNGALRTLELELLVDTREEHVEGARVVNRAGDDVRKLTERVVSLLDIEPTTHAPPIVLFSWGSIELTAVLTRADQTFTMFRDDGIPIRARLQLSLSEFVNAELEAKEIKRETADYTKTHVVAAGDTLWRIAATEYGHPRLWRSIAAANELTDPRRLEVGTELVLPRLPYIDPQTGREHR